MDRRQTIPSLVGAKRALVGMIHVQALPGTPRASMSVDQIVERAVQEARTYRDAGFNALAIENMHDVPYLRRQVGPEVTAVMSVVGREVKRLVPLPLGVQVLAGANHEALSVALAANAQFIRVEGFVFAHVADEGIIESNAGELLRYRKALGAEHVQVFADIKKKHSAHAITADVTLVETAHAAEFFLADGLIVTGVASGAPADPTEVDAVHAAVGVPTLVGSGITPENMPRFAQADGFIVGSFVKEDGLWSNRLDSARTRAVVQAFEELP